MGETKEGNQDIPQQQAGQSSDTTKGSTSTPTFTEEQFQKRLSDALAEQGRKHKQLEVEIQELSESDGEQAKVAKLILQKQNELKALETERAAFKKDKEVHDAEWAKKQERITHAEESNFEIELWDLCEEYDNGNAEKLKAACVKAKITDIEGARGLADVLWVKKSATPQPLVEGKPASGETSGGIDFKSIRDAFIANPNDPKIYNAYMEARRLKQR